MGHFMLELWSIVIIDMSQSLQFHLDIVYRGSSVKYEIVNQSRRNNPTSSDAQHIIRILDDTNAHTWFYIRQMKGVFLASSVEYLEAWTFLGDGSGRSNVCSLVEYFQHQISHKLQFHESHAVIKIVPPQM